MAADTMDRVTAIIVNQLGIDASQVTPGATLVGDLGADSLDLVEMTMSAEAEFETEVPAEDAERIQTVQDAVAYFDAVVDARATAGSSGGQTLSEMLAEKAELDRQLAELDAMAAADEGNPPA